MQANQSTPEKEHQKDYDSKTCPVICRKRACFKTIQPQGPEAYAKDQWGVPKSSYQLLPSCKNNRLFEEVKQLGTCHVSLIFLSFFFVLPTCGYLPVGHFFTRGHAQTRCCTLDTTHPHARLIQVQFPFHTLDFGTNNHGDMSWKV